MDVLIDEFKHSLHWKGRPLPGLDLSKVWEICRCAGVEGHFPERIPEAELERRLKDNEEFLEVAIPHLEWMVATYGNIRNAVYILDRAGICLYSGGSDLTILDDLLLLPGYDWSQDKVGNNGAGTALAFDRPVVITGAEHFVEEQQGFTCMGAPIHDPDGKLIGSIDFSTHNAQRNPERLAILIHIAHTIEQDLAHRLRARQMEYLQVLSLCLGYRLKSRQIEHLQMLSRLSAFMAHELATPLTTAAGLIYLLQRKYRPQLIDQLKDAIDKANETMKDIRSLGHIHDAWFETVPLNQLSSQATDGELSFGKCQIEIRIEDGLTLDCHRRLLKLAVKNIVRNAAEAIPGGGNITISAKALRKYVEVTISDNGPGVPAEIQRQLFRKSITTKTEGTGLGLLLVRTIVEQGHGGQIRYEPNEPRGAKFVIRLPIRQGKEKEKRLAT